MKRIGILNHPLSSLIASLGHTDALVVCDAGLPIPRDPGGPERIDLAVSRGVPSFLQVLEAVLEEELPERAAIARETQERSPALFEAVRARLGDIPIEYIDHDELKARTIHARGVVRTGECTPFANVILYSGVTF